MHSRGLVFFLFSLLGTAHRITRISNAQYDAQRQNKTLAEALDMSADARETFLPRRLGTALRRRHDLQSCGAALPLGVGLARATVHLLAASGPQEVQRRREALDEQAIDNATDGLQHPQSERAVDLQRQQNVLHLHPNRRQRPLLSARSGHCCASAADTLEGSAEDSASTRIQQAALLESWLSTRATGIGDRVVVAPDNTLIATVAIEAGDTVFALSDGLVLTARAAYADREMGIDLQAIANRVGPGFDSVALAAFLAVERLRRFNAETWYAGSAAEKGGLDAVTQASEWSPLTVGHWKAAAENPSGIPKELLPLVEQGVGLVLPLVELAARRVWTPGRALPPLPRSLSLDAWLVPQKTDDRTGWGKQEIRDVLVAAFELVLARQWPAPPPILGSEEVRADRTPAPRWGFSADAPAGAALLPPLRVLLPGGTGGLAGTSRINAVLGVPPEPALGNFDEGVSVKCVATRRIERGESIEV